MRIQMNRIITRCLAALTAGFIATSTLISAGVTTQAASSTGTLTITPKCGDKEVDLNDYNGTFKVYKVADYDNSGTFTATADFQFDNHKTLLTSDNLSDEGTFKEITQTVTAWVANHDDIDAILSGVKAGVANTVDYGLYLIMQDQSASGYSDANPFLVMIPSYSDGKTETAVTAYPKISKSSTPDTPDKPHKPHDDTPTTPAKTGKVELNKTDADTQRPLQGVIFSLYRITADGEELISTKTTDENGVIFIDHLPYGKYYFIEIQPLEGYEPDTRHQNFTIDAENTVFLTITNTKEQPDQQVEHEDTPNIPTGDESNMILYGVVAGAAVIALVGWVVWQRRNERG